MKFRNEIANDQQIRFTNAYIHVLQQAIIFDIFFQSKLAKSIVVGFETALLNFVCFAIYVTILVKSDIFCCIFISFIAMGIWIGSGIVVSQTAEDMLPDVANQISPDVSSPSESLASTPTSICSAYSHPSACSTVDPQVYSLAKFALRRWRQRQ